MSSCSTCGGARPGYHREWWHVRSGQPTVKRLNQGDAEQSMRDADGAGRIERRVVADDKTTPE